jgi:DNA polymerase-3 subunit alpha
VDDGEEDRPVSQPAVAQRGRNDGQIVKIGGILSGVTRKVTKKGDAWAAVTLEDLGGAIEVLFFPNSYQLYATAIADDAIVIVKGKVDRREDVPKLIAMDMTIPDLTTGTDGTAPFVLNLAFTKCVPPVVEQLREVLRTHPGTTEVHLRVRGNQKTTVVRLDDKLRVTASPALHADLKQLLGPSCIAS